MLDNPLVKTQAFIGGKWVNAKSRLHFGVFDPASGIRLSTVPDMNEVDTANAILAADRAFSKWKNVPAKERSRLLKKWLTLVLKNRDALAELMTMEQGKPLSEAKGEVSYAASYIEWFSEEAKRTYGDIIPAASVDKRISVIRQPIGVCAAITPWNFPLAMIARKVAPALAAGCTMIVKPAEATPLTALALAELADQAGLPNGVLNIVTSSHGRAVGAALTESPIVRKLTFTGSTETGRILLSQCAPTVKRTSMELGGNAPFIVFDDANIGKAVEGLMASKFRNSGQTCVCANRIFVHEDVLEPFIAALIPKVKALVVGNGLETGTQQGPLINEQAVEKVESHIADAVESGATIALGGSRHNLGGTFFQPTILNHVNPDMRAAREETFGPVVSIIPFKSEDEVVRMANDTIFGLASYLFTENIGRMTRVSEALEYGMVAVNTGAMSSEQAPFGGVKQSGMGREGSKYGIEDYMELKYICLGGLQ